MASKATKRPAGSAAFTSGRVNPPRIKDADERVANVERATKRIKTDVQVNFVRTRRGRR
jgi:hypothetical protein